MANLKHRPSYSLDLPHHTGHALHYLVSRVGTLYAVVDDGDRIWAIRPTHLGAARVASRHRRREPLANYYYARYARVVSVSAEDLRETALAEARATVRAAAEVECVGGLNGGLSSAGALAAISVLRECGDYAACRAA